MGLDMAAASHYMAAVLPVIVAGAMVGIWCVLAAQAYAHVLAAGGYPDAASLRAALLHALYAPRSVRNALLALEPAPACAPQPVLSAAFSIKVKTVCAVLMAACFAALSILHGITPYFAALAAACAILLLLSLIDARTRLLPDALTLPLLWLGLALAWAGYGIALQDAVAGAMAGYGFLWLLSKGFNYFCGQDGMGNGDFKLLAALGAWLGWQPLVMVLLVSCVAGVLFAMGRQKSFRPTGSYPFGPFLAAGGVAALLDMI